MPFLKNVLGLDLGSHSIKAVELAQGLRSVEVVRFHAELRDPEQSLTGQLSRMLITHSFHRDNVVAAVRGDRVSVRRLSFPFAEKRRIAQAVPFELEDQVPFDIADMVIDWGLPVREGSGAQVASVLAPRTEVSALVETLHQARCDARIIESEGLVLSNLASSFEFPGTRLLVDIGHHKTTLCAIHDGVAVSARSLSIAGRSFTEAVAQERSLSLDEAERWKHERGIAEPGVGSPFPRADAVLGRLANEIRRFAESLATSLPGGVGGLVLFGGGAQLDRIDGWLAERTEIPTERLGAPRVDSGLDRVTSEAPLLLAPALALALRGSARSTTRMNLRQDEFARRADFSRVRREYGSTGILAAIVAVLALVSFSTGAVLESSAAGGVEAQIAALYREAFPDGTIPDDPVAAMREAVREAEQRAEFLGVYRGNLSALDVFTEISKRVPKDLDVGLEELAIDKQTIRLRVQAKSFEAADRLGTELAKFPPFEQAQIGAIETDPRTGGKKFNVTISLASDSAAREPAPERGRPAPPPPVAERPAAEPVVPAAPAPIEEPQ